MRQLLFVLALAIAVSAVGFTKFTASSVVIKNRPFVIGNLEATTFHYDKPNNRTGWTLKASPSIPGVSVNEAYLYTKMLRLRQCADDCEALGEDLAVPDLVSTGAVNGNSQPGCPTCYSKTPTPQNGKVEEVCYNGQSVCYVEFESGEEWFITGAQQASTFPNNAFLQTVEDELVKPGGGKCDVDCNQKFDIVLVLDESGSIDSNEWADLKSFAQNLVDAFEVGPDEANFAIKLYSTTARDRLSLSPSKSSIIAELNGIDKKNGYTCIGCGLQLAVEELDANKRPGVPGLIITLTDGFGNRPCDLGTCCNGGTCASDCCKSIGPNYKDNRGSNTGCSTCGSRPKLQLWSDTAKARGYKMISIGVGNSLNDLDLELISTNWRDDHIAVANFAELQNKLSDILRVVCPKSPVNACGTTCLGYCHCGQTCGCPICEDQDKCHKAKCIPNLGYACKQEEITCSDGNLCTIDKCNPDSGCDFSENLECKTNKDCKVPGCNPATGCFLEDLSCPDTGDKCVESFCEEKNGAGPAGQRGCQTLTVTDQICYDRAKPQFQNMCWEHFCSDGCKRRAVECVARHKCETATCDPNQGCVYTDITPTCTKSDLCKNYGCLEATGCFEEDKTCNDGVVCTNDICVAATGMCDFPDSGDCGPCQDINGVNVDCAAVLASQINGDQCLIPYCDLTGPSPMVGVNNGAPEINCKITNKTAETCITGNQCVFEGCDASTGLCTRDPKNCTDNNLCTINGCDPATGCTSEDVQCSPRNECETATCDPAVGCVYTPIDCTALGADLCKVFTCDPSAGCQSKDKCVAPNACHSTSCDPATGTCTDMYLCDDGNNCTDDMCSFANDANGTCVQTTFNATERCNDFSVCTEDICEPATGCKNVYEECPNVNVTLPCKEALTCHSFLGCREGKLECFASNDKCFSASCQFFNATADSPAINRCIDKDIDNVVYCELGIGATTGIALSAGVVVAIIIALVVLGILGSVGAWKAYDALMASNIDSGLANPNPLHEDGVTAGDNPLAG